MRNKGKVKITGFLILLISFFSACNHSTTKSGSSEVKESLETLKQDLNGFAEAIENLAQKQSGNFQEKAVDVLNQVDEKIDQFQEKAKKSGDELDEETKSALEDLKVRSDKLKEKIRNMNDKTENTVKDSEEELKHDFIEFGKSVKGFFEDNV